MENYSAIKSNDISPHAERWMSPKNMLSERSQTDTKDHTLYKFVLYDVDRRQTGGSQGLGDGRSGEWEAAL